MSMLIGNKTKQWRKCFPTLRTVLGTHTMTDHPFVIKTLDTKEMLGVHWLTTFEEDTLECEILQEVGEDEKEGKNHIMRSTHPSLFQKIDAQKR